MDGLSSASAVFAVVSIAVQLAETIHKLVEFWKAVEDAPDNITRIFQELGLLSKILTQSHGLAQCHSFSDIFDEALGDCSSKIFRLYSKVEETRKNLKSGKLHKRKWAAWKIVLQKAEIDSLQRSISDAKLTILLVQNNSLLARPFSTSNVYQFNQNTSHANTQILQSMQITERELVKSLTEKQNLLDSVAYYNEKLLPDTVLQPHARQDDNKQRDRSQSKDVVVSHHGGIGSRKRYVTGIRGRHVAGPFSNIWTGSQKIREQVVHASGVKETVEDESQLIMYPSKWLARLGVGYGVKLSILASRGWQYSFQPFRAVPESSLIFQFCREGNLGGVRTLLSRGDASPYDRDPSGRTPLWYAALHHQLEISEFLLSEGADVQAMDWINRTKPIDALYDGECNDIKLKIAMANILSQYDAVDDDVKYRVIQRFLIFFRHAKLMDLSPSRRNEAALSIVQHISSYYLQTHPDLSGLLHNYLLPFYYDGPILQWVLRSVPGKIRNEGRQLPILHQAINKGLLLRDPLGVKTLVEKSTTADIHLYIENSSDSSPGGETPTSLAMYDWEGFLTWRTLLRELGFDMLDFVSRELAAVKLQGDGWTQETLIELFKQDLPPPSPPKSYNQRQGFRLCDRCQQPIGLSYLQKVDLEWRRKLRSIRTGKNDSGIVNHCSATIGVRYDIINSTNGNGVESALDPLPYRIVCPRKCEDGICVAWEFENFEPPNLPPYIPKEERKRLERLRLLEEEAKCPTYTMPGAFRIQ